MAQSIMTVFFTRYFQNGWTDTLLAWGVGLLLASLHLAAMGQGAASEISQFKLESSADGVYLSASLDFELSEQVEDALAAAQIDINDTYTALGWIYTVEGSNLGAAFLLKIARTQLGLSETFGARHLAGHDDGRGLHWRRFREDLDAISLTDAQRNLAQEGALAAFHFVRENVELLMSGKAP